MANNVLFEIGVEEIPSRFIDGTERQLLRRTEDWLHKNRIKYNHIQAFSTPRRLAVLINGLAGEQTDKVEEIRGPKLDIAKTDNDTWTKAAIGFTKGQGATTDDIVIRKINDIDYIFVKKQFDKKPSIDLLPSFTDVIKALEFPQTMKWGEGQVRFVRPIRWLVALYNEQIIPLTFANIHSSNITYGHRFLSGEIVLADASHYETVLLDNYVVVNVNKREEIIIKQCEQIEDDYQFIIPPDDSLLNEVRNLVEYPTVFVGKFDIEYLSLPKEVLVTTMKTHQRYFSVISRENELLPYFIGVRNGTNHHIDNIIRGNEKVLRARLSDAQFFFEEDKQKSIDYFNKKVKSVVFQEEIGTFAEKVNRVKRLSLYLCKQLNLSDKETEVISRTAEICKFDLVTNMVNEFPELQGVVGETYANFFNENKYVAEAIREHYMPIHTNDQTPSGISGSVVSVADKIDTLVGCFSVGLIPTGSQDPYGLRRQAIGMLRVFQNNKWDISIKPLFQQAFSLYNINDQSIEIKLNEFINQRLIFLLKERSIDHDIISSILHEHVENIDELFVKAYLLSQKKVDNQFIRVQEAFIRVINLGRNVSQNKSTDPTLIQTESERELFDQFNNIKTNLNGNLSPFNVLTELTKLANPIHQFLDHNLVMSDDEKIKQNRLNLLHEMANMILSFADFTLVEWNYTKSDK